MRFVGVFGLLLAGVLHSQTLGTVMGEVKDGSGASIAGAMVTVRNTDTNGIRTVATNEEGLYNRPGAQPGHV